MEQLIKRIILSLFPELKNGYHKPQLGIVANVPHNTDGTSTQAEPIHCIDLQPVDQHMKPKGPLLRDVAVSLPYVHNQRGFFGLPGKGCIVEYTFSYFMPNLIHIRGVLPYGMTIPAVGENESAWMHSENCYQKYDADGNWDQLAKILNSTADIKQLMKSPKTWIGSDNENVLRILSNFMQDTADALTTLSTHTHLPSGLPAQESSVASKAESVGDRKGVLDSISE